MAKFEDVDEKVQEVPKVIKNTVEENKSNYFEIKGFPSKMKFYPEGTKILGKPLTVLQVKALSSINEVNADGVINSVLKKSIIGIDIDDLLTVDKLFIIFWLRANTYRDSSYTIKYTCESCGKETDYQFTLDKLDVKEIKDTFTEDLLKVKLLKSDYELEVAFPRVRDERLTDEFKRNYGNVIKDLDMDIVGLATLIKKINGSVKNMLEKYNFIISMDVEDYSYLLSYIENISFGVSPLINTECQNCGVVGKQLISFSAGFFLPTYNF